MNACEMIRCVDCIYFISGTCVKEKYENDDYHEYEGHDDFDDIV